MSSKISILNLKASYSIEIFGILSSLVVMIVILGLGPLFKTLPNVSERI
jgi:hypothetical protein